jgi:cytoskeletal protein RodZ
VEIGKTLKEARETMGLSLEAVEEETKIRRKYIQALEREEFQVLPGPIYAKAFLKNYAKFLGIKVEEVMEEYRLQYPDQTAPEETLAPPVEKVRVKAKTKTQERPRYWVYVISAIIIIGVIISILYGTKGMWQKSPVDTGSDQLQAGEQNQLPAPQQPLPGQVEAPKASSVKVALNIKNDRSWVRVVVDGVPSFQGELAANQSKEFEGKEKIAFTLGNAGVVEVIVNGQNMGFLGSFGQVIDREFKAPGV